ncbi:MAG: HAMP domain-containing histidine kinase [Oscillospiraceae bacterium]|nr:HAMP domain-containing histidine kinase [Oscillospiraceae bacterium]
MKKLLESKGWRALALFLCLVFGLMTVACGACGLYDYFEFGMDPGAEPNYTESDFYYAYVHERPLSSRLEDGYVNLYMFLFNGRMVFLPLAGAGLLLTLALFAFLLASAGRTPEGVELRGVHRWPLEVYAGLLAAVFLVGLMVLFWIVEEIGYIAYLGIAIPGLAAAVLAMGAAVLLLCMTLAARIRAGQWWKNTVCYFLLRLCGRLLRALGRTLIAAVRAIPVAWKLALVFCGVSLINIFGIVLMVESRGYEGFWLFALFLVDLAGLAASLLLGVQLRRLRQAGQAMAAGDLSYTVDTQKLWGELKAHGEDLNAVRAGLSRAVNERMRSERFKTELITNVSHDLKTPLTSIVNYVDLLKKEEIESPQAREYIKVLDRQSQRLRKLTEDLVDASKASSGVLPVSLETLDLRELVTQAGGEYAERLSRAGVETVTTLPEGECPIRADGRLLWRVLDNLFLNVCKYAQSGTRFYVNLQPMDHGAALTLRNISREPLNIPAEELMERFVRGDRSRSGEGSGLGLSIARSLMECMGGSLDLSLDGDLFKVTLYFPQ